MSAPGAVPAAPAGGALAPAAAAAASRSNSPALASRHSHSAAGGSGPPSASSTAAAGGSSGVVGGPRIHATLIAHRHLRFLVFDAPSSANAPAYLAELQAHGVTEVVRVCEPTYDKGVFEAAGVLVHDWPFTDGEAPPKPIVQSWLALVERMFGGLAAPAAGAPAAAPGTTPCIGVHCVAGLGRWVSFLCFAQARAYASHGPALPQHTKENTRTHTHRAPVLVAMALIESGMAPLDSVIFIRERRRGAINARQLKYIEGYRRQGRKDCCIM
jgi:protein tyrosine phosphatase type 4A